MDSLDTSFAKSLASGIYEDVRKTRWNPHKLRAKYANRSGEEVLTDGETFYMGTCPDLTLATAFRLQEQDEPYTLAVEVFEPTASFQLVRPHLALDLPKRNRNIDFTRLNQIRISTGQYTSRSTNRSKIVMRINSDRFNARTPLHINLGYSTREDMNRQFDGLRVEELIERMIADHTDENYESYRRQVPVDKADIVICN
jgi:hypothetical protein